MPCFTFGSLFVGTVGGLGIGQVTGFFDPNRVFPPIISNRDQLKNLEGFKITPNIEKIKNEQMARYFKFYETQIGKYKARIPPNYQEAVKKAVYSNSVPSRMFKRGLLSAVLYSFLECKFQGGRHGSRSFLDCGLAGAITGGLFGLRAGSHVIMVYSAGGFALWAAAVQLFLRW